MKALIIGRFQPFHLGHLGILNEVDTLGLDEIILGIGTNGGQDKRHPFDYQSVRDMIAPEAEKLATHVEIYRIPDIYDPKNYAKHVENITGCTEKDTIVVSMNPNTVSCFTGFGNNYQTYTQQRVKVKGLEISATAVRDMITNDGPWKEYVPESTKKVIEKTNGAERLKEIYR
jgi:nicotinamide-nucleotide adenylyltransferase